MKDKDPTIALDFDNTLVRTDFPTILYTFKGAKKFVNKLHKDFFVIIWSCNKTDVIKKYLEDSGIKYDTVNESNPIRTARYGDDSRKVGADIYVDDKGILKIPMRKNGHPNFKKMYKIIKKWDKWE